MSIEKRYILTDDERTIFAAIYIILVLPIFFANVWIALSIFLSKRLRSSTTNWIVFWICGNRAVPLITRIPTTLIALLHKGGWPSEIPEIVCTLASGADINTITSAAFGILLLAVNRYMKTAKSDKLYRKVFNFWSVSVHFFLIWVLNLTFTSLPPLIGFGAYGYNLKYETCSIDDDHKFNDYYAWVVVTFGFPMQFIFTLYFFAKTFQTVEVESRSGTKTFDDRLIRVNKILFAVSMVIIIFYLPFVVLYAVPADLSYPYRNYGLLFLTFSDALIPIIFLLFHSDIKSTCIQMYRAAMSNSHDRKDVIIDEGEISEPEVDEGEIPEPEVDEGDVSEPDEVNECEISQPEL